MGLWDFNVGNHLDSLQVVTIRKMDIVNHVESVSVKRKICVTSLRGW